MARKAFTKQKIDHFGRSIDAAYLAEASRRHRIARLGGSNSSSISSGASFTAPLQAKVRTAR